MVKIAQEEEHITFIQLHWDRILPPPHPLHVLGMRSRYHHRSSILSGRFGGGEQAANHAWEVDRACVIVREIW